MGRKVAKPTCHPHVTSGFPYRSPSAAPGGDGRREWDPGQMSPFRLDIWFLASSPEQSPAGANVTVFVWGAGSPGSSSVKVLHELCRAGCKLWDGMGDPWLVCWGLPFAWALGYKAKCIKTMWRHSLSASLLGVRGEQRWILTDCPGNGYG